MATDAQIQAEAVWKAEYTPAALKAFGTRVGTRLRCTVYYKGDTNHLRGRHRSRNWALRSAFCTNRSYGTTNAKDKAGPGDALRGADVMISGDVLEKVCRGIDEAVRAGLLPELAEWFGTFDSRTVVGWFEGHASSSDSSHLTHLHLGVWTQFVELVAFFDRLFDAMMTYIDGGDDMFCKHGDKGEAVKLLQLRLLRLDPKALGGTAADGAYGDKTAAAVKALLGGSDGRFYGAILHDRMEDKLAALRGGVPGPQGPAGPTGPAGPAGTPGKDGVVPDGATFVMQSPPAQG